LPGALTPERETTPMMAFISNLIGTQPILAVFLTIGLGYAVGQVNILGFSLGVGAVLFVGLFVGAIAPKAQIAGPIGLIGLIMFLYGIGILYGRQFFEGLTGPGRKYNLLAFIAVLGGLFVALGLGALFKIQPGHTLGVFAGSMTSTPTLQAALDVTGNGEPSIGYSVTYPFGVIGPILCFYFMTRKVKPTFPPKPARFHMGEVTIERLPDSGATIAAILATMPEGVQIASVRQQQRNLLPDPDLRLRSGDGLLIAADDAASLQRVVELLGRLSPGRIAGDP
jgi:putative transport protein